ncbi:MAG TPA: rRNA maturation RNase YbeY [Oscillospiraceae bacterium]|nr:rRNA maturation RNase YbeY [Oscillospiraceae bacterium]HPS34936.1 rRNA maturation RNase YbeY [Oscillospiraceae bacterium]
MRKNVILTTYNTHPTFRADAALRALLRDCCCSIAAAEKNDALFEVNLTFMDDMTIRSVNYKYRNIDNSTDVLSFPMSDGKTFDTNPASGRLMLGDILISADHAFVQAEEFGHSAQREFAYLTVHAMLHLFGYDHMTEADKRVMREKEEAVLERLGLTR